MISKIIKIHYFCIKPKDMQEKTSAIVLYTLPYNDKMSIAHLYTEKFGRVGYLLPSSDARRNKRARTLFFPFSILELDVEHKPLRELQRIREFRPQAMLNRLPFDPVKRTIALFLSEIISKTVTEPEPNRSLYEFLVHSIQILDLLDKGTANFHLCFLIQLSSYLGFYPNMENYTATGWFDLLNGIFVSSQPAHPYVLAPKESRYFAQLMRMNYANLHLFSLNRNDRIHILDRFVLYFRLHLDGFKELKSLDVLKALFD